MTRVTVDAEMRKKLMDCATPLELCDESGYVLAKLVPSTPWSDPENWEPLGPEPSEEEIQRLKSEVSLERLATAAGVELKQHGKDLLGRCPFHDDREPSLVITPEKNLWHCLGECQTGGTVIDWVMRAEGVSFRHAVELLQDDALPLVAASSTRRP